MSSSSEIQTVETSTLQQAEPSDPPPTFDDRQQMECRCSGIWDFFCRKQLEDKGPSSTGGSDSSYERRVEKLKKNLKEIELHLELLEKFQGSPSKIIELRDHLGRLNEIINESKKQEASQTGTKTPVWIPKISKEIMKFKQQISSTDKLNEKLSLSADLQSSIGSKGGSGVHELGNVHQSESFSSSSFYNEIAGIFEGLEEKEKFLLSCFTVFPENAVVKRRIFVYWGLGEEELRDAEAKSPEKIVDEILEEFQEKGLIEPAIKKRKQPQRVKSYRMDPLVCSSVILLSKEAKFFDYDGKGNTKLPHSIGNLSNLVILDLKECHNLEILSEEIVKLKKLRYLDVSDCYLVADMPKGLRALSKLQVLKGFVISNRQQNRRLGTLPDLKGLRNLRKLTINARSKDFPTGNDLSAP